MKILMLFLDGVGLGEENSNNPLFFQKTPTLNRLLEGRRMTKETPPFHGALSTLLSCDASLGWPGLPQSATGQTALFTGVNPVALVKGHQRGFPGPTLRKILGEHGVFTRLKEKGLSGTFANAYRPSFFSRLQAGDHRYFSATTVMVLQANLPFRSLDELKRGQALYQDIDHSLLKKGGEAQLPIISPYEAGKRLARLSEGYDFTLFEFFLTDMVGHAQNWEEAGKIVTRLDNFLAGILQYLNLEETFFLLTSDHGNFEDLNIHTHTHHPVPVLMLGPGRGTLARHIHDLSSIVPAMLDLFYS